MSPVGEVRPACYRRQPAIFAGIANAAAGGVDLDISLRSEMPRAAQLP
jgi:hypothetical protein